MKKAAMLFVIVLLATGVLSAQEKSLSNFKYQFKVGVLPFMDATGTGNDETGTAIGRAVQAELVHSTSLMGRVLKLEEGMSADDIDPQKAVELGRNRKVDVVLIGTVLEAEQQQSNKGIDGVSIFGQSVGGRAQRASATVIIQADLFNVTNGKKIDSFRVTGKASDTKVGADAHTTLGSLNSNASEANSPLGKALKNAVTDVVRRIAASESKMIRYQADDSASNTEEPQSTGENEEE
ncbi:MAG TPA: CsgG/HfaB family protein [Terriglobales bacterium]|nr:CsgG/HfaB family protein [Terriglobales bacterium]